MGYGAARIDTAAVEFFSPDAICANSHSSSDLGKGKAAVFFLSWPWRPGLMDLVHPEIIGVTSTGGLPSALQLFAMDRKVLKLQVSQVRLMADSTPKERG